MRQVPEKQADLLLIGKGKLAKHLECYFNLLQIPFQKWDRSQSLVQLADQLNKSKTILLAISDSNIQEFYNQEIRQLDNKICIHFSGSLEFDDIISIHPMMSFGDELFDFSKYKSIAFNLFEPNQKLGDLIPGLENPSYYIPKEQKGQYHAHCALVGNLPQLIWNESIHFWNELDLPLSALRSFVVQSFDNVAESGDQGVTGPIKRNDKKTIHKNINDIESQKLNLLYKVFADQFSNIGNRHEEH